MEQRWGLPLIAWPSRLRPNVWDIVALPLVLGALTLIVWGGTAMGARYEIGDALPISLDPWRLPEYALRTVLRMAAALVVSLVFTFPYAALAAKSRQAEKILIPFLDICSRCRSWASFRLRSPGSLPYFRAGFSAWNA